MTSRNEIKNWFYPGAYPTAAQFHELLDSYFHHLDEIGIDNIENLRSLLNAKAENEVLQQLWSMYQSHVTDKNNPHGVTPAQIGLDATRDIDKPVSKAVQDALLEVLYSANHYTDAHATVEAIHKTSEQIRAEIVESDIPDTIARCNYVLQQIALVTGNAADSYNTLEKLQTKLNAVEKLIYGDDADNLIETLQEALGFINAHKAQIDSLVNTYIAKADIANDLYTNDTTKVLSAKMGTVLYAQIDSLNNAVTALNIALSNKADNIQTFAEAAARDNIQSGESVATIFGKLKKWVSDLKAVAFTGSYNDLSDKPTSLSASDVYAWAKAVTKPSYAYGEISNTPAPQQTILSATEPTGLFRDGDIWIKS